MNEAKHIAIMSAIRIHWGQEVGPKFSPPVRLIVQYPRRNCQYRPDNCIVSPLTLHPRDTSPYLELCRLRNHPGSRQVLVRRAEVVQVEDSPVGGSRPVVGDSRPVVEDSRPVVWDSRPVEDSRPLAQWVFELVVARRASRISHVDTAAERL